MRRPLIIDCDPGQDDAINILLTLASADDFDLLGITTVAGNVPLEMTQKNARIICELAGRGDVPVYAGCPRPMVLAPRTAHQVHGPSGLDGMELFEPTAPLRPEHAVDFLVDSLRAAEEGSVTLAPTGPLTNIAMALVKAPDIASKIREIVLMGGAMREGGNFSPSAEFNILVD
ncbi:MAG: nucleoside hydrolase, partial [Pseudomonadota bacterium]